MTVLPVARQHTLLREPAPSEAPRRTRRLRAVPTLRPRSRSASEQLALVAVSVVTDAACLVAPIVLASVFSPGSAPVEGRVPAIGAAVVIWVTVLGAFGVYRRREPVLEAGRLLGAVTCALWITHLLVSASDLPVLDHAVYVSLSAFALLLVAHGALQRAVQRAQRQGRFCRRALIVGADARAAHLDTQLRRTGLTPVGFVPPSRGPTVADTLPLPIAGEIGDLGEAIRGNDASCIVASSDVDEEDLFAVVRAARRHGAEARIASPDGTVSPIGSAVDPVGVDVALALKPYRSARFQVRLKRVFDVAAACIGLLLMSPLLAVVALAVLVTSGRPVFFRQQRITGGGRAFTLYKFRTMVVGADRIGATHEADSETLFFKNSDHTLLTPIGAFLRRFSIDELPQLWNVVRGDMSLVGPRPLPTGQVVAHAELLGRRHDLPTGLTGWWQVNGRGDVDAHQALDMDLFYVDNWSIAFDMYILARTVRAVLSRTGAY